MILGVDPGLATCGWALVREADFHVERLGVLLTNPEDERKSTDRSRRAVEQASHLVQIARACGGVRVIAAEAMSIAGGPARFAMAMSLGLGWGVLSGVAVALDVELVEVAPKLWQHAIAPGAGKVDYDQVAAAVASQLAPTAAELLERIPRGQRNHALDAAAIGIFAAVRPHEVTVIRARGGA